MAVTYSYIMKMNKSEILSLIEQIREYLEIKKMTISRLKKKLAETEIMVNDVERKLKMVGIDVHKL